VKTNNPAHRGETYFPYRLRPETTSILFSILLRFAAPKVVEILPAEGIIVHPSTDHRSE